MNKTCRQCGAEIFEENFDSWRYCPKCGDDLLDEKSVAFFERFFRSKRNIFLLLAGNVFVIGAFSFFLMHSDTELEKKNEELAKANQQDRSVKVEAEYVSEVFPVTYWGENQRIVTLKIDSPVYGKIKIRSSVEGIADEEEKIVNIRPGGSIVQVGPEISLRGFNALRDSKNVNFSVEVKQINEDDSEKTLFQENKHIFFYGRGDIIWNDKGVDNSKYIARWIDKDRSEIAELVRKASDLMKGLGSKQNAMVGYLSDEKEVQRQMEAIFSVIAKEYNVRYVFAPYSYDNNKVQRVKLPKEILETKSGLCIELVLLAAASFEHVGLYPVVVLTSGHAWVGVETGVKSGKYIFMETTALDKTSQEAIALGQSNWEQVQKEKFPFRLLNIHDLRMEKIIPFRYE